MPIHVAGERILMTDKSPQKHNAKKTGKSLKEKRADKKAKKAVNDDKRAAND
jgi:hypothetical protein